ncbi:hypothetical protein VTL71DRAFT_13746 [Oculimacula yallundae]|uniref:Uncharacterized protein n=1 Tax=Oculimacula yallundae TaxID=86028 RepID=A0ABR4CLP7_9HELO
MISLLSLFSFLTTGGNIVPWTHLLVILADISFTGFATLFFVVERNALKPVLPLDLLFRLPTRNIIISGFLSSLINYTTARLNTPEMASTRLIIPSITFTVSSALTGSLIAHYKTPLPALRLGQLLLVTGTLALVLMAALLSLSNISSPWPYNIVLAIPTTGVGMMAPSVVLTLLNMVDSTEHAVANRSLIMMRSLGVFVATALGSSTLQNIFRGHFTSYHYGEKTRNRMLDKNVQLIHRLEGPLKSQVVAAYGYAFTAVFGLCAIAATVLVVSLAQVKIKGFEERESGEKRVRG